MEEGSLYIQGVQRYLQECELSMRHSSDIGLTTFPIPPKNDAGLFGEMEALEITCHCVSKKYAQPLMHESRVKALKREDIDRVP
jgi:hypothetical protein